MLFCCLLQNFTRVAAFCLKVIKLVG